MRLRGLPIQIQFKLLPSPRLLHFFDTRVSNIQYLTEKNGRSTPTAGAKAPTKSGTSVFFSPRFVICTRAWLRMMCCFFQPGILQQFIAPHPPNRTSTWRPWRPPKTRLKPRIEVPRPLKARIIDSWIRLIISHNHADAELSVSFSIS